MFRRKSKTQIDATTPEIVPAIADTNPTPSNPSSIEKPPPTPEDTMGVFPESTNASTEKESVTDKLLGKDSKARVLASDSSARKEEAQRNEKLLLGKSLCT